jgi:hypothetical protein
MHTYIYDLQELHWMHPFGQSLHKSKKKVKFVKSQAAGLRYPVYNVTYLRSLFGPAFIPENQAATGQFGPLVPK